MDEGPDGSAKTAFQNLIFRAFADINEKNPVITIHGIVISGVGFEIKNVVLAIEFWVEGAEEFSRKAHRLVYRLRSLLCGGARRTHGGEAQREDKKLRQNRLAFMDLKTP